MKISKHSHSCLLIEEQGKTYLIDPGLYTVEDKSLDVGKLEKLDYILITHEHTDHMYIPLITELTEKFPQAQIISNASVKELLGKDEIPVRTNPIETVTMEKIPHEDILLMEAPENLQITVAGKLTHPGDSHHVTHTAPIFALPVQAPWGSMVDALRLAVRLKPEIVIPIHDWHWNDTARDALYSMMDRYLTSQDIRFLAPRPGEVLEI